MLLAAPSPTSPPRQPGNRPPRSRSAHLRQRQRHRPLRPEPLVVIKPSGVDYASLTPGDLVVTNLDGKIVEGSLRPSSDLDTHTYSIANFRRSAASSTPTPSSLPPGLRPAAPFPASAPPTPTTSTAPFPSPNPSPPRRSPRPTSAIPAQSSSAVSRPKGLDPIAVPGVLVAGHAPFAWGKSPAEAVEHADVLEYIARLAFRTVLLRSGSDPSDRPIPQFRCTFPNTTTSASTAPKPPTASASQTPISALRKRLDS
jgi:L-ribulose-5-phosphate 4-epimerase